MNKLIVVLVKTTKHINKDIIHLLKSSTTIISLALAFGPCFGKAWMWYSVLYSYHQSLSLSAFTSSWKTLNQFNPSFIHPPYLLAIWKRKTEKEKILLFILLLENFKSRKILLLIKLIWRDGELKVVFRHPHNQREDLLKIVFFCSTSIWSSLIQLFLTFLFIFSQQIALNVQGVSL